MRSNGKPSFRPGCRAKPEARFVSYNEDKALFLETCKVLNTPRSLSCYLIFTQCEFVDEYLALSRPDPYSTTFADDYLVTNMMRKNEGLPLRSHDRKEVAFKKWLDAEDACRRTNSIFSKIRDGYLLDEHAKFMPALKRARAFVRSILGSLNQRVLDEIEAGFRYGPGSSSACTGKNVILSRKVISDLEMTPRLSAFKQSLNPFGWSGALYDPKRELKIVYGSKLTFVPKDAVTDRPICIEPHINQYVQLGIGRVIRHRLRRFGIDLDKQADKNRKMARIAHKAGLATIDLSSASDTISDEFVKFMLPSDWYVLLDTARCRMTTLPDGRLFLLAKFSSMGNGFTFELETLLFLALCVACNDIDPQVFGDDIIVSQSVANDVIGLLTFCGFETNRAKTFLSGNFFESCGNDYFRGVDIRPIFLRGSYADKTEWSIRNANRVRRYSHRLLCGFGCDVRFRNIWRKLIRLEPVARKTGIPHTYGDGGLIKNFDEFCPATTPRRFRTWCGTVGVVYTGRAMLSRNTHPEGAYLAALQFGNTETGRLNEAVRGLSSRPTVRAIHCRDWPSLGPWL